MAQDDGKTGCWIQGGVLIRSTLVEPSCLFEVEFGVSRYMSRQKKKMGDQIHCLTCLDSIDIYAVGQCNHRDLCHVCALRYRLLYKNGFCPHCKTEIANLVLTRDRDRPFEDYSLLNLQFSNAFDAFLAEPSILAVVEKLDEAKCPDCGGLFSSKSKLKAHAFKAHGKVFCPVCLTKKKAFFSEKKLMLKKDLALHMKKGDDETPVHPLCLFCKQNYYDNEDLMEHMDKAHFKCPACAQAGKPFEFYNSMNDLEDHFDNEHYRCRHPACLEKKFIVFVSELDLEAHELEEHFSNRKLTQRERKQRLRQPVPMVHRHHGRDDDQSDSTATPSVMSFPPLPSGTENARPPAATPLPLANLPDAEIVARNRQLLAKLQEALPSPEAFQHFKSVSQAFQRGDISAASFYETLINSCGSRSSEIFGDLVALLPHAQRRSELIAVHQSMLEQHAGEMGIQTASFPSLSQTTDVPKPTSVRSYAKIHSVPASADSGAWPSLAAQGNTTVPPALDTGWGIPNTASSSTHSYGSSADEEQRRRKNKKGKKVLLHFG